MYKGLKRRFTKEDMKMANKHMNNVQYHVIRELLFKTVLRYHYLPLEWPKSKTLITVNACEDVEKEEFSLSAGENSNGIITLENSLVVPYKTKHTSTIWSSNQIPWYLPKWMKNLCQHSAYSSFICIC